MTGQQDWARLGREISARRKVLRLPQDLVSVGGPSEFTIRRLERGETETIRPKTRTQLEHALQWKPGLVDDILNGTATPEDLRGFWAGPRDAPGTPIVQFAFVGEQAVRLHRPPPDNDNVTVQPGDTLDVAGVLSGDVEDAWIVQHSDQTRRWPKAQWKYVGAHRVVTGTASANLGGLTASAAGQALTPTVRVEDGGVGTDEAVVERVHLAPGEFRPRFGPGERIPPRDATIVTVAELLQRLRAERDRTPSMDDAEEALLRLLPELYGIHYPATAAAQRMAAEESERRRRKGEDEDDDADAPKRRVSWPTSDAPSSHRPEQGDQGHSTG